MLIASILIIVLLALCYSLIPTYYFKFFHKKPQPSKSLYLTFDDGPSTEHTPLILDLLHELDIKATFFVVAAFADKCPHVVDRMLSEGHNLGLHSLQHDNGFFTTPSNVKHDFEQSIEVFKRHGWPITIYRAPWGRVNLASLYYINKYKLRYVLWNVLVQDWQANATPEIIYQKLLERAAPGYILCLHDGRGFNNAPARTLEALRHALPALQAAGYIFEGKITRAIGESNG